MWTRRSIKTSAVALGLVAILAGVAVAYFLTRQPYPGNTAVGGQLTVDSTLPLNFTDTLYPINSPADGGYAEETFTITNNNTVPVDYKLFATCDECAVPAGTTPTQAQLDKQDQFDNLWVQIDAVPVPACAAPGDTLNGNGSPTVDSLFPCPQPVYYGKLKDLTATTPADLNAGYACSDHTKNTGNCALAASGTQDYRVRLWLQNDPSRAQPQAVTSIWEFFLDAKTPQ